MKKGLTALAAVLLISAVAVEASAWTRIRIGWPDDDPKSVRMEIDGTGRMGVAYGQQAYPDQLKYLMCDEECFLATQWSSVLVDYIEVDRYYDSSSLRMDQEGNPRIAYYDQTNQDLKFATCDSQCELSANWTKVFVDFEGDVGQGVSLHLDEEDNPRILYFDNDQPDTRFAYCDGDCHHPNDWDSFAVDVLGGQGTLFAARLPGGAFRAAYRTRVANRLRYVSCESGCTDPAGWTASTIDLDYGEAADPTIAWDSLGRPHLYYESAYYGPLYYATCNGDCHDVNDWEVALIDDRNTYDHSIALTPEGYPRLVYHANGNLHFALCDEDCGDPISWTTLVVAGWEMGHSDIEQVRLFLTPEGYPRIAFSASDPVGSGLVVASCDRDCADPADWNTPTPAYGHPTYYYPILELDHEGRPLILAQDPAAEFALILDCADQDLDRTSADPRCGSLDCDDDSSDDPPACETCECGDPYCGACARCRNIWSSDYLLDGIDSNCDGEECFIATAALGSGREPQLEILRQFRDRVLKKTGAGRVLVDAYYAYSPPIAAFVRERPAMRAVVRVVLAPVVGLATLVLAIST